MVHLAPDSRLLVSLVKQEQTYATQLHNLLNASGTSLSALAVYASSSPPTVSPVLNGVAGALSGADEALRTYGEALNDWINQLGRIKQKEDEVATIGRDREILVTRLLKVSQKSKSPPPSLLNAPDPSSSTSFSTFNSKINNAQSELQACESRLADKERELERVRIYVISQGLKLRCSALIQCGRVWSDMGGRAVEMLSALDGAHSPSNGHATEFFKPLPDPTHDHDRDSVLSSLSPSQSASQIGAMSPLTVPHVPDKPYRFDLPPPHLVSDAVIPQTSAPEGSSSSDDEGPVEVHENTRFNPAPILNRTKKNTHTWTAPSSARHSPVPFPATNFDLGPSNSLAPREKKRMGLFGNIAALFRTSMSPKNAAQQDSTWTTRTNHNLRSSKTDGEQSSDEEAAPIRSGRLRKAKGRAPVASLDERRVASVSDSEGRVQASTLTTPRRKRSGKLDRAGTVRSTVSEPATAPRLRATTLTTISPVPAVPAVPNGSARRHGRTASMDGRWGLADTGADTASLSTWKPGKNKGESLMRIVEAPSSDDPSSRLEVVRAPGSSVPRLPLLVNPPPPLVSASAPSSPVVQKAVANKRASMPVPTSTTPGILVAPAPTAALEKKPLRSAMRRPSPSPSSPRARPASENDQSPNMAPLSLPTSVSLSPNPKPSSLPRREVPSTIIESPRQSMVDTTPAAARRESYVSTKTDDTASISSYETGHENMDDEEGTETEQTHVPQSGASAPAPPPPPPPASEKAAAPSPQHPEFHAADQHELSSATSTDTAGPSRRKSVRMSSLPPQMSATPPALDEYNDADHAPWSKPSQQQRPRPQSDATLGWKTRIPAHEGALTWEDSSSEDEVYKAARNALSRADRRSEKKGKR